MHFMSVAMTILNRRAGRIRRAFETGEHHADDHRNQYWSGHERG
jgi:hypothetical protein